MSQKGRANEGSKKENQEGCFFPLHLAHCNSVMTKLMNYLIVDIRNRENLVQNKDTGKK